MSHFLLGWCAVFYIPRTVEAVKFPIAVLRIERKPGAAEWKGPQQSLVLAWGLKRRRMSHKRKKLALTWEP